MRHTARKLKKRKPSLTFTNIKLLHSKNLGKSTYFYKQRWNSYFVPAMCALALLLGIGFTINPITGNNPSAHAAINEDLGNGSTISLAISNNGTEISDGGTVSTEVEPGELAYISNSIKVTTNKIARYYVGIQAANDGSSDLVGTNTGATISGTGSNVKPSNFSDNTWGYVLTDNTTTSDEELAYSTLPAYDAGASLQYQSNQYPANGEHEMKLVFAAKIRADKPADHYQTKALVSVAAEANKLTMANITYMQDISADICSNTPEADTEGNNQYQLKDNRDNKLYWVAKLKDGNCWMTQNLDLDLNGRTLTTANSDVTENWTSTSGASGLWENTGNGSSGESSVIRYYDPGIRFCANSSACTATTSQNGGHDAVGNYYTFGAAVAGKDGSKLPENSICPKGWKIPDGYSGKTYSALLASYGNKSGFLYGTQDVRLVPLYFVMSGYIKTTSAVTAGFGLYWANYRGGSAGIALDIRTSGVYNTNSNWSYMNGLSIRCVAR